MPHDQRPVRRRYGSVWHDQKAPDGFTVNGWRKVHKGGYVRMVHGRHYHTDLAQWVGKWVFVEIDDGWAIHANVWPDEPWKDTRTMLRCSNEEEWFAND